MNRNEQETVLKLLQLHPSYSDVSYSGDIAFISTVRPGNGRKIVDVKVDPYADTVQGMRQLDAMMEVLCNIHTLTYHYDPYDEPLTPRETRIRFVQETIKEKL